MILKKFTFRLQSIAIAVIAAALVAGCSSSGSHAPVVERGAEHEIERGAKLKKPAAPVAVPAMKAVSRDKDGRPQVYTVQKGDTLYSIAFNYGLDYREIAELNSIHNHGIIQVGKELRLPSASASTVGKTMVESKPLEIPVKSQPKVAKLPYTEQAVAQIEKMQEDQQKSEPVMVAKVQAKPEIRPEAKIDGITDDDGSSLEWSMPTSGTLISEFSESASRKGIDIAGKLGQAIVASSAGKVVYSGSGLRGYGKLVIIKHNKTYLSAYAHNDQLLVKEGQNVNRGQKIAEMGNTDTDQVSLHFEIRRFGKPVDPAKYLPLVKS
ncbi:peptidoglycan DD-metalloendopeptidase family protein [Candidatus Nitrotoga sp. 1052]|uniref:peptidoglycan DD-metalloendopeptidase family protein n=1 Tax=Candidatus Nitrotoga sp. 1052 TaxID=2886964 RepID=UPI001EF58F7B|nr:peptidoglycan DD-metalloendopeptidase family protein [Candidatus Nitrotoga sp. 1052]CAH1072455.1 Lipoprotein NlpD/LppB homolog [Candidatus Nitrotoga sp. 1052]